MNTQKLIYNSKLLVAAVLTGVAVTGVSAQDVIRSPVAVLENTAGNDSSLSPIESTIDRSGLSPTFVSGVTLFDGYIASNPKHSYIYTDGAEWFSVQGKTSGTLIYDMGADYQISRLALWNEEFSGIQTMRVSLSNDPNFGSFTDGGSFNPTDTPFDQDYPAEVFVLNLPLTDSRYVRLDITGPQTLNRGTYLSMGEIAFATSNPTATPDQSSTAWLLGLACAGIGLFRRR